MGRGEVTCIQGSCFTVVDTSQDSKPWQTLTVLSTAEALREQLEQTITEATGQAECSCQEDRCWTQTGSGRLLSATRAQLDLRTHLPFGISVRIYELIHIST